MFRKTTIKKKQERKQVLRRTTTTTKRTPLLLDNDNDNNNNDENAEEEEDDDDEINHTQTILLQKHKKKKKKRTKSNNSKKHSRKGGLDVLSFEAAITEEEENVSFQEETSSSSTNTPMINIKKKKRRTKGLGFGGGIAAASSSTIIRETIEEPTTATTTTSSSLYGMEALERLKAEQKTLPKEKMTTTTTTSTATSSVTLDQQPIATTTTTEATMESTSAETIPAAADFISLNNNSSRLHHHGEAMEEEMLEPHNGLLPSQFPDMTTATATATTTPLEQMIVEEEMEDDWQDQIARRAGISTKTSNSLPQPQQRQQQVHSSKSTTTKTSMLSLDTLKHQLHSTLDQLKKIQDEDLTFAIQRRQADLQQTQADRIRHLTAVQETGKACQDYQILRNRATLWVGALRELKQKVDPLWEAISQLLLHSNTTTTTTIRIEEEWIHCQDDAISVLKQAGMLDQIVGRQPTTSTLSNDDDNDMLFAVTVDEFGRDVQSQYIRDREKRYRRRMESWQRQKQQEQQEQEEESKGLKSSCSFWSFCNNNANNNSNNNNSDTMERYQVLQEALQVAVNDLDEDYTSLENLIQFFLQDWMDSYPEEFRQCYANLSLGDLAAILVQVEMCRSRRLLTLFSLPSPPPTTTSTTTTTTNDDDDGIASAMQQIKRALEQVEKEEDDTEGDGSGGGGLQRVVEKNQLSFLVKLLKEAPTLCFLSSIEQCDILQTFLIESVPHLDVNSKTYQHFQTLVFKSIQQILDSVAIPIVKNNNTATTTTNSSSNRIDQGQLEHALHFAREQLVIWVQHLVLNILKFWMPQLQKFSNHDEILKCLLDFISSKFLFLLSTTTNTTSNNNNNNETVGATMLAPIWEILSKDHATVLESPEFFLQCAPIRAAAMAYGLLKMTPTESKNKKATNGT